MGRNNRLVQDMSQQRISHLFELALENATSRPDLSDRYVAMALKIAQRTRVHIPKDLKNYYCKSCKAFVYPGINSRIRINQRRSSHLTVTCLHCGHIKRFKLKK